MLVIDHDSEECLLAKLESMDVGSGNCCLWMYRSKVKNFASLPVGEICKLILPYITCSEPLLCVFEDGDCCLLAGFLSCGAIDSMCTALENAVKTNLAEYILPYDLTSQYSAIKVGIEAKIKGRHVRRLKARTQQEELKWQDSYQAVFARATAQNIVHFIQERRNNHFLPVAMIVEDDAFTRQLISSALNGLCELIKAEDGKQAINLYPRFAPDILFLDIELPDIIGFEILD